MSSYRHETGSEELDIGTDTVVQMIEIRTWTMNMKQGLKHGIISSSVENLVEDGVERNRLFLFHLPHNTACQC